MKIDGELVKDVELNRMNEVIFHTAKVDAYERIYCLECETVLWEAWDCYPHLDSLISLEDRQTYIDKYIYHSFLDNLDYLESKYDKSLDK